MARTKGFLIVVGIRLRRVIKEVVTRTVAWGDRMIPPCINLLARWNEGGRGQPVHARIRRWTLVSLQFISSLARGRPSPQVLRPFSSVEV